MDKTDARFAAARWAFRICGRVLVALVALTFAGCSFSLRGKVKALSPAQKKVLVIGHGGLGFLSPLRPFNPYPANSMTSLKKALAAGADGLEVDIHLSQDGIPILFHDLRLEPMTAARGLIEDRPAAGVLGLPYQGGFPYDLFQREKVAAFEDLLRHIQAYPEKPYLHLDLRQEGLARPDYYAYTLLALLRRYQYPMQKVTLISPEAKLLQAFRQSEPRATCLLDSQGDFEAVLSEVLRCGLPGLVMNAADMNPERMRRVRQHRLQIVLFGPKAPRSIYKALLLGPDALQVNNVTVLVGMVKRD